MKKFEAPTIRVSRFVKENILTASGVTTSADNAVTGLITGGSDLLKGRDSLSETSIIQFVM